MEDKVARWVKLAIAIGVMREGAVHSCIRKVLALGISADEINAVIAYLISIYDFEEEDEDWE